MRLAIVFEIVMRCGNCGTINEIELSAPEVYSSSLVEFDCQSCKCPLFVLSSHLTIITDEHSISS